MSTNDGGPAFPSGMIRKRRKLPSDPGSDFFVFEKTEHVEPGMSLRDWFAGMAMQGFLANPEWDPDADTLAKWCFARADAMLVAREKK